MFDYADTPAIRIDRTGNVPTVDYLSELRALLKLGSIGVHDVELTRHLKTAIAEVEQFSGHFLGPATITLTFEAGLVDYRLNQGPVTASTAPALPQGWTATAESFPLLTGIGPGTVSYQAGWTSFGSTPFPLISAVLERAANRFDGGTRDWMSTIGALGRKTWAD
ncbi:hypothetical protein FAES_3986 [Fibrella aestuarina BUZ 2]|uniref:Uncharacterized protein n=1 Tax=Fibrella aestuarina BUZ 2 TaxID=1166018 RepID=I0KCY4_9BACT|nr:hypothetical protein [Fibrella aestuarina]CCH01987.1 hypothetical protein FAES_3986 [Fibrella aestuarina BUZ 2]